MLKGKPVELHPTHLRANLKPVLGYGPVGFRNDESVFRKRRYPVQSTSESVLCQIRRSVARPYCAEKIAVCFKMQPVRILFPVSCCSFYEATTSKHNRTRKVQH